MSQENTITLEPSGQKMPLVGLGTWKITNDQGEEMIYRAIKNGYRLIDTALLYDNQEGVGKGIRRAIDEGIVKREDVFVTAKLWNCYHHKSHVRPQFERDLKQLGLDYIDLYHIHWPIPQKYVDPSRQYPPEWVDPDSKKLELERSPLQDLWRELEALVKEGKLRNIGISNFNVQLTLDLLTYCEIKPAVLQIEMHPYLQRQRVVDWFQKQGIQVTAYSQFGPEAFDKFTAENMHLVPLMEHETIKKIADKHGKTTGQVLLRWQVQRKVAVIPKSSNDTRQKQNLDLFSWSLDDQDYKAITDMDKNIRYNELELYGIDIPLYE
ncbi:hypothetical protein O0I10_011725 [Lichtheimia ornata]|uniref:NADP-dependent oxidoreductase domain-containing protein n=1 Tax=Lichtheimia ornata TaxID=688661 RepID=A0AAD7USI5_9FUNG|nr:uncharacterized protein O0I10_011725 [Lichtheimia ornata]KAJ8652647.1 hypothetical protein O0I10_011725 [Lichtheimia ornata]